MKKLVLSNRSRKKDYFRDTIPCKTAKPRLGFLQQGKQKKNKNYHRTHRKTGLKLLKKKNYLSYETIP